MLTHSLIRRLAFVLGAALLIASSGCGANPNGPSGQFHFTAKIDGKPFTSDALVVAVGVLSSVPGFYQINGYETKGSGLAITLSLSHITGTGKYPLGVVTAPGGIGAVSVIATGNGWASEASGESGTITLTTLTSTRIGGTFSFTATAQLGVTGKRDVTFGDFLLEVKTSGTGGPEAAPAGSSLTTTIAGKPWVAGDVLALKASTTKGPNFQLVSNSTRGSSSDSVTIYLSPFAGVGQYTPAVTQDSQVTASYTDTSGVTWATLTGGGAVTVSSSTASRVEGYFTVTLYTSINGSGPTMTISGNFSVEVK